MLSAPCLPSFPGLQQARGAGAFGWPRWEHPRPLRSHLQDSGSAVGVQAGHTGLDSGWGRAHAVQRARQSPRPHPACGALRVPRSRALQPWLSLGQEPCFGVTLVSLALGHPCSSGPGSLPCSQLSLPPRWIIPAKRGGRDLANALLGHWASAGPAPQPHGQRSGLLRHQAVREQGRLSGRPGLSPTPATDGAISPRPASSSVPLEEGR